MERRKLLKSAAIPIAAASSFVYGSPAAAAAAGEAARLTATRSLLELPLTRGGLPEELREPITRLAAFWGSLNARPEVADALGRVPESALKDAGLDTYLDARDPAIALMRACLDPSLRKRAESLDLKGFVQELEARGFSLRSRNSRLQREIRRAIQSDLASFKASLTTLLENAPQMREQLASSDRLNALLEVIDQDQDLVFSPFVVAALAIAATVVLYVSVAVGVTVAITAGFSISIAVAVAVVVDSATVGDQTLLQTQRDVRRAAVVARVLGRSDLASEMLRKEIEQQVAAVASAVLDMKLLRVQAGRRREFEEALRGLAFEVAGV